MSLAEKAKGHFDSACAFLQRGNIAEAITQLSQAIAIDLKPDYFFHRSHLYLQLGDVPKARADLQQAEALVREVEDTDLTPGDIEQLRGEIETAARSGSLNRDAIERYVAERQLEPLMAELGFANFVPQLKSLMRPSFRLKPTGGTAPTGASKLGGFPDLPAKFEWPRTSGGVAMAFVCQINLGQAIFKDCDSGLPHQGMLYLFFDATATMRGQHGEYVLVCRPVPEPVFNVHAPDGTPQDNTFFEAAVMLVREDSLPDFDSPQVSQLLPPQAKQAYDELLRLWYGPRPWHRLLGCSQGVQRPLEASLPGGRLVLQVDTDADCCMQWADGGRLFVGARDVQPFDLTPANVRVYVESY